MSNITERALLAFHDELRKEADLAGLVARAAPRLRAAGSLAGTGAAGGALLGGGLASVRGYHQAKEEGASTGGAALRALAGAGGGAVRGAGIGAAVGGGVGLASGRGAALAQQAGRLGAPARFGERQLHSMVGHLKPHELEQIGGGAANARSALQAAQEAAHAGAKLPGKSYADFAPSIRKAQSTLANSEAAQNKGLTSIPGYLRAAHRDGVVSTLRTSAKEQFGNMGPGTAALMVGLPAVGLAGTLARKESPDGPGKAEQAGAAIGGFTGQLAGGAMPLAGNIIAGGLGAGAGKLVGRGIDRLRGRQAQPMLGQRTPSTEPSAEGQHMPVERTMSPAAAGQHAEV